MALDSLDYSGLLPGDISPLTYAALSLRDQYRYCARERVKRGLSAMRYTQAEVGGDVPADTTPDWADAYLGAVYRQVARHFTPGIYRPWGEYARRVELVDYRVATATMPPAFGDLGSGTCYEASYMMQLRRFGRQFTLPWLSIENNDKDLLSSLPDKLMTCIERTIAQQVVRNVLENPGVRAYDDGPLFYGDDAWGPLDTERAYPPNLLEGEAARFSYEALVSAGRMLVHAAGDKRLNPTRKPLGLCPRFLVVPTSLEFQAAQVLNSLSGLRNTLAIAASQDPRLTTTPPVPAAVQDLFADCTLVVDRDLADPDAWYLMSEQSPLWVAERAGCAGFPPRLWRVAQPRQAILGGAADDYLLAIEDLQFGVSFDCGAGPAIPWGTIKCAPGRPPGTRQARERASESIFSEVRQERDYVITRFEREEDV